MDTSRAHLLIEGRVQGVFYRSFTRKLASRLGLIGWARNLPDGRVEAVFEGSRGLIEQAVGECWKGPMGSSVRNIDIQWEQYSGEYKGFDVLY